MRVCCFPSVEHAYQAFKSLDPIDWDMFSRMKTPGMAKRQGRCIIMREDWDDVKVSFMSGFLQQKFLDPELKQMLLDTGTQTLIEGNTWNDTFWGECPIGNGKNTLGKLLMDIRAAS